MNDLNIAVLGRMREFTEDSAEHRALDAAIAALAPPSGEGVDEDTHDAINGVLHRLESWGKAYPIDMFGPVTDDERTWLHSTRPGLMDRISASMGRHMAEKIADDIAMLRNLTTPDGEADELILALGFDPERFRTECGFLNHYKLRAAIRYPENYEGLALTTTQGQWVPVKPEGAPYWGIHTATGETVAGTSSGLSEGDARLICDLYNERATPPPASQERGGWQPISNFGTSARAVLLYNPSMDADEDFPGHPYVVANPMYAKLSAAVNGYTMWRPITPPQSHDGPALRYAKTGAIAASPPSSAAECETCNGLGIVGGVSGQTPESMEQVTENCPDCGADVTAGGTSTSDATDAGLCGDCPPVDEGDKMRCLTCPRRAAEQSISAAEEEPDICQFCGEPLPVGCSSKFADDPDCAAEQAKPEANDDFVCEICAGTCDADEYIAACEGWRKSTRGGWICPAHFDEAEQAQAGELPQLPSAAYQMPSGDGYGSYYYTADQMREYANACRLAGGVTVDDEMVNRAMKASVDYLQIGDIKIEPAETRKRNAVRAMLVAALGAK